MKGKHVSTKSILLQKEQERLQGIHQRHLDTIKKNSGRYRLNTIQSTEQRLLTKNKIRLKSLDFREKEKETVLNTENTKMLNKLVEIQMGKYHKVNIDSTSVSPSYYSAGGFKSTLNRYQSPKVALSTNLTSDSINFLQFPNGKQVEHHLPKMALHELKRKQRKKEIEFQNYRLATKLYTTRAAVTNNYVVNRDFKKHQKLKSLRCQFPVIDMKNNIFTPNKSVFVDKSISQLKEEKAEYDKMGQQIEAERRHIIHNEGRHGPRSGKPRGLPPVFNSVELKNPILDTKSIDADEMTAPELHQQSGKLQENSYGAISVVQTNR